MPELARQPLSERPARTIGIVTAAYAAGSLVRPTVEKTGRCGGACERPVWS
jgi:hypothetical protein